MKFHIDIDCTPEEARRFLGLPDVAPMQKAMMEEVQRRLQQTLQQMDPETLMKTWMPAGIQGWGELQKAFWQQWTGAAGGESGRSGGKKGGRGGGEGS